MFLKELIFHSFYFWECGGLERTDLKELIFHSFYFGRVWWFERTDF